jgi:hypothetical protein
VVVLKAWARQVAHEQAQLLADVLEVAYTPWSAEDDVVSRVSTLDELGGRWPVGLAQDLIERLPMVYTALLDGRIDLPRARAFSEALAGAAVG